jgi:formamidopyrimidine-DNA glycosylase
MPELPEITVRAREMKQELVGKTITDIEVIQPKSLNIPEDQFINALLGTKILDIFSNGKWVFIETTQGWLLLNLGMGGEILLTTRANLPEKRRLIFDFDDRSNLAVNFWWFGYAHYAPIDDLEGHAMTAKLGPNALDVSQDELRKLLDGRRGRIKSFLLDQSKIAGIGNAYIHDALTKVALFTKSICMGRKAVLQWTTSLSGIRKMSLARDAVGRSKRSRPETQAVSYVQHARQFESDQSNPIVETTPTKAQSSTGGG